MSVPTTRPISFPVTLVTAFDTSLFSGSAEAPGSSRTLSGSVMIANEIEPEDLQTLEAILERELLHHRNKCRLWLALFIVAFASLVLALICVFVQLAFDIRASGIASFGGQFQLFQVLAPLAGSTLLCYGAWGGAQNCLTGIERSLFAARSGRFNLFRGFLGQIQCAGKHKTQAWLEIVKGVVT